MQKPWLKYHRDLHQICAPLLQLGVTYFAHQYLQSNGAFFCLPNDPSVAEYYFSELGFPPAGFANFHELKTGTIILYEKDDRTLGFPPDTLTMLREGFNIIHPIFFIQKNDDFAEMFVVGLDSVESFPRFMANIEYLENFLFYYKDKAKNIINHAKNMMSIVKPLADFLTDENKDEILSTNLPVQNYWMYYQGKEVKITKSEFMVLDKLAHGMSAKEVSNELGIAIKTVDNHKTNMVKNNSSFSISALKKIYWKNRLIK